MTPGHTPNDELRANPGYAKFQISQLLQTSNNHEDAATRKRARAKIEKWQTVWEGMISGHIAVGSRRPILDAPVWATPEVITGGFATGCMLAGGALQNHEIELASRLGIEPDRELLNSWYLTEGGLAELAELLRSSCYEIHVPEEAGLLVVAWLAINKNSDEARELIEIVSPYFSTLRFYPSPAKQPVFQGHRVFLESVGTVVERLQKLKPNTNVLAQREAVQIWTPYYQKMISLFLETVDGNEPAIEPDSEGRWAEPETGRFYVAGGWPCRAYPQNWQASARSLVASIELALVRHQLCGKPRDPRKSFAKLFELLKKCSVDSDSLTGREVGQIRLILARHVTRNGTPGSKRSSAIETRKEAQVARPLHHQVAAMVIQRLERYPAEAGIDDLEAALQISTAEETAISSLPAGTEVPTSIARKVERCLCESTEILVERGVITSGDTLSRLVPQFIANLRASAIGDPRLQTLYTTSYRAFRRRRSLLLLNFATQVRFEELPWVSAMEKHRHLDATTQELSRQALKDMAGLTLRAFPHAILPNKLLQEFRGLARDSQIELPFVEEIAADIFMGEFTPKFTRAAKQAVSFVKDSLYARYFEIDCAAVLRLSENHPGGKKGSWFRRILSQQTLGELCLSRTGTTESSGWSVARNGMIIEQSQILTTHNLALLFGTMQLETGCQDRLYAMARECFEWICRRQKMKSDNKHAKLIMLKQTAYAWRQMIFYVSRLPHETITEFIREMEEHLSAQSDDFRWRFSPTLQGLALAHEGKPLNDHTPRFLGWTTGRHWLLRDPIKSEEKG